jgi:hypothetical protein
MEWIREGVEMVYERSRKNEKVVKWMGKGIE